MHEHRALRARAPEARAAVAQRQSVDRMLVHLLVRLRIGLPRLLERIRYKLVRQRKVDVRGRVVVVVNRHDHAVIVRNFARAVALRERNALGRHGRIAQARHHPFDVGLLEVVGLQARGELANPQVRHHLVHPPSWALHTPPSADGRPGR